jgi:NAD(P)H dehydrogenase (quinone)
MVRVLVIYDSLSGNTEKMATVMLEGVRSVEGVEAVLKRVDAVRLEDLEAADGIILGSPTYYGQMSGKLKAFIDSSNKIHGKLVGKVGGAFTSCGGAGCGAETTLLSILNALLIHGMIVQGMHEFNHYGAVSVGAPGKRETEVCMRQGEKIAKLASRLSSSGC